MKTFDVPVQYRSPLIAAIKRQRKAADKMKRDFTPSVIRAGALELVIARHFGFCYGVENAIEIAFRAISENPEKRIFLLSEMIHNPGVNADLQALGVQFLMDTQGNSLIPWDSLRPDDIVIIPAFGTTLELERKLSAIGIEPSRYETTCPFVEKVWNRAERIGQDGYTIVVHGKAGHEETRATFSHSRAHTPTIIVQDKQEAVLLASFITGERNPETFYDLFQGRYSEGFDVATHLRRIGVVNQTTMLASETQSIADYLKQVMRTHYRLDDSQISAHFADTRDTLCYATADNQAAVLAMLADPADFALVIGGYNSSNTSHLVELCEEKLPTYFISHEDCLISRELITHFDWRAREIKTTTAWIPPKPTWRVLVTSGASCPDALVERVLERLALLTGNEVAFSDATEHLKVAS